ncbi:hypothetical protein [Lactococcus allomyrinae]|uniref:Uncharacterized protein n=1 Tax=Lactococcus allomyrinae TaxID=2419773 RepID=A0A387BMX9_9LACT|nr:hypothetical protein [Lactococcus allomyrinae]AYF99880.1 hypothetical protein D7I46_01535 [Lactococcus allomyrinae]
MEDFILINENKKHQKPFLVYSILILFVILGIILFLIMYLGQRKITSGKVQEISTIFPFHPLAKPQKNELKHYVRYTCDFSNVNFMKVKKGESLFLPPSNVPKDNTIIPAGNYLITVRMNISNTIDGKTIGIGEATTRVNVPHPVYAQYLQWRELKYSSNLFGNFFKTSVIAIRDITEPSAVFVQSSARDTKHTLENTVSASIKQIQSGFFF